MGVEYKHFLIPTNPTFVPGNDAIRKIDAVLNKWNLKTSNPKVYDLTNGQNTMITADLDCLVFGQGLAIEYPGVEGLAVRKIMGASYFNDEVGDEDRYIERLTFVVGL